MSPSHVHVISKSEFTNHTSVAVDSSVLPPLSEGSVRIKSHVISVSVNNMAYAQLGVLAGWWNTYPVPSVLPEPYNDQTQWGIVPAWGYGKVVESKDESVPEGTLIWGYWPTSSLPVDFKFKPAAEAGYLWEVSEHRKGLMSLYNFYEVVTGPVPEKQLLHWKPAALAVWFAGQIIGQYGFPVPGSGNPVLSLNGQTPRTAEDADLSSAVVVSLAASSKTSRGFTWHLINRKAGENTPLALIEGTTSPDTLPDVKSAAFETRKTSYDDLSAQATIDWIIGFKPSRVVIVNCGAGADVVRKFQDAILASDAAPANVSYITLVSAPGTADHPDPRTSVVHMNTSPVIDNAFAARGIKPVLQDRDAAFEAWVADKAFGSLELALGDKIEGDDGVEGAWGKLATGKLPRNKALIFEL